MTTSRTSSGFAVRRVLRRLVVALAAFLIAGNLGILLAFGIARAAEPPVPATLPGLDHLRAVNEQLWRGEAPSRAGYVALADAGVVTIVDLRAERDIVVDEALLAELGMERIHIPIRDGQTPTPEQVRVFFAAVDEAPGDVFVHCGAGVGRTGTMAAAYLVREEGHDEWQALRRNLAVGPPSLEQILYVLDLEGEWPGRVPPALVAVSRLWDAPRRIYTAYLAAT